jgi:hypothetical protein
MSNVASLPRPKVVNHDQLVDVAPREETINKMGAQKSAPARYEKAFHLTLLRSEAPEPSGSIPRQHFFMPLISPNYGQHELGAILHCGLRIALRRPGCPTSRTKHQEGDRPEPVKTSHAVPSANDRSAPISKLRGSIDFLTRMSWVAALRPP